MKVRQDPGVGARLRDAVAVQSFTACLPDDEGRCGREMIDRGADRNAGHHASRRSALGQVMRMTGAEARPPWAAGVPVSPGRGIAA